MKSARVPVEFMNTTSAVIADAVGDGLPDTDRAYTLDAATVCDHSAAVPFHRISQYAPFVGDPDSASENPETAMKLFAAVGVELTVARIAYIAHPCPATKLSTALVPMMARPDPDVPDEHEFTPWDLYVVQLEADTLVAEAPVPD